MTTKLENVYLETLAPFRPITEWFQKFQGQTSRLARCTFWGIVFLLVRIIIQTIMNVLSNLNDKYVNSDKILNILIIICYSNGYSGPCCWLLGIYRQFKF